MILLYSFGEIAMAAIIIIISIIYIIGDNIMSSNDEMDKKIEDNNKIDWDI